MPKQLLASYAILFALVVPRSSAATQGTDLRRLVLGTWELNVAKSTYHPGPPPKNLTRTYEASGEGVKYTDKMVGADGKTVVVAEWTGSYDGRDYPVPDSPDFDMQAVKANANDNTVVFEKR